MDAPAYLSRYGWRGNGYSLDLTGHGIVEPLLISHKNDLLGVGKHKFDAHTNQWWIRSFDETVKKLRIGHKSDLADFENVQSTPKSPLRSPDEPAQLRPVQSKSSTYTVAHALYTSFVQGESLTGTLETQTVEQPTMTEHDRKVGAKKKHRKSAKRKKLKSQSVHKDFPVRSRN